jgi:hypothetical protein
MVQNKTFTPEIGFPSPVLKGLGGLPPLHGYVLTTPKERLTEEILQAHLPEEESSDPVLARWKFGLGTTAAFTSDLSTNWGAEWVSWEGYRAFVKQLMIDIARVQEEEHLRMWAYASGTQGVVVAEDFHPQNMFLEMQAQVSGPQDKSESVTLRQIAPRRYQATFPLWGPGRYQVMAIGKSGDRTARAQGGFIVSYSPEYLRFRSNPLVLDEIAEKTGGKVLSKDAKAAEIYLADRHPSAARDQSLTGFSSRSPVCCRSTWLSDGSRSIAIRSRPCWDCDLAKASRPRRWAPCSPANRRSEKPLTRSGCPFPRRPAKRVGRLPPHHRRPHLQPRPAPSRPRAKHRLTNRPPADCSNSNANASKRINRDDKLTRVAVGRRVSSAPGRGG